MVSIVFFIFFAYNLSAVNGLLPESNDTSIELQQCIANLEQMLFSNTSAIYIIDDGIFTNFRSVPQVLVNAYEPIIAFSEYAKNFIIVAQDRAALFHILTNIVKSAVWNNDESTLGKFLIVMLSGNGADVFEILWKFNIVNAVIVGKRNDIWTVFSSDPYHLNNDCGTVVRHYFVQSCFSNLTINFPKPTPKIGKCALNLNTKYLSKFDYKLVENLYSFLKNHVNVVKSKVALENKPPQFKTNNAAMRLSSCNRITLSILTSANVAKGNLTYSDEIFREHLVWVSPVEKNVFTLDVILSIFKCEVWIMIIVGLIATSSAWWAVLKVARLTQHGIFSYAFTNVYCLTICGCIRRLPVPVPLRMMLVLYLFYVIVIQTAFQANLVTTLTSNTDNNKIESVEDVANSNMPICMFSDVKSAYFAETKSDDEVYNKIRNKIKIFNSSASEELSTTCIYLFFSTDFMGFVSKQFETSLVNDNKYTTTASTHLTLNKPHFVTSSVNELITRWKESGIFDRDFKSILYNPTRSQDTEPSPLTLKHVSGVFAIWGFGMVIASVAFIIECLIYNVQF